MCAMMCPICDSSPLLLGRHNKSPQYLQPSVVISLLDLIRRQYCGIIRMLSSHVSVEGGSESSCFSFDPIRNRYMVQQRSLYTLRRKKRGSGLNQEKVICLIHIWHPLRFNIEPTLVPFSTLYGTERVQGRRNPGVLIKEPYKMIYLWNLQEYHIKQYNSSFPMCECSCLGKLIQKLPYK